MAKSKKRSDFLFFVISVALLYGTYYLFIEPQTTTTDRYVGKQSPELQAYMVEITTKLKKKSSSSVNSSIIERSEAVWLNDPFYDTIAYGELTMAEALVGADFATKREDFTYSGFLNTNAKKIAIINDLEYEVGETIVLTTGMYVLEDIHPTKVIIGNKVNKDSRVIHLQETEE